MPLLNFFLHPGSYKLKPLPLRELRIRGYSYSALTQCPQDLNQEMLVVNYRIELVLTGLNQFILRLKQVNQRMELSSYRRGQLVVELGRELVLLGMSLRYLFPVVRA